ncbi:MAG: hypothetical protein LUH11_03175 [Candidatus Gastranaerophilales bacterium]|nr:hypothetical protein [Candidatus Gastranaerophilales bacterium]
MKVSLNLLNTNKHTSYTSFSSAKPDEKIPYNSQPSKDEILTAKTKKAVSECKYIALGICILYFAMKRNFKVNKVKNLAKKAAERAKDVAPIVQVPKVPKTF